MSNAEDKNTDQKTSLSCSMTFQNAIEIDFAKLREMAKQEALEKENADAIQMVGEKESVDEDVKERADEEEDSAESLCTPLSSGTLATQRDLSMYDRPLESHDPESSSDEDDEDEEGRDGDGVCAGFHEDEPETEVENSDDNSDNDGEAMNYEQLGGTEFTKTNSDDDGDEDGAQSDGEFGEFECCTVSHFATEGADVENNISLGSVIAGGVEEVVVVDRTQDVLGSYHPRTAAVAIPPLDQAKIDIIKQTMAALNLKPLGNAARVADAVIRAKPRVGDELKHATSSPCSHAAQSSQR